MLCLKKRRTYSFTQGVCADLPRRSKKDANNQYGASLNMTITTLPRKNRSREERPSRMVLTVTEDTPADMLAGSMELLVQLPRDHQVHTQKVTVQRSTPMMDLLVQIATANKLAASSYTLQAIGERGMLLPHQPNTPIGALDALQVKLLPKQGTFVPRKTKQANQPFETTFRLQVHLPRNQLYVSRVSPKMNLGEILEEVCREKNLDKNKYELRHPGNLEETLDLSLSLQDYHLQEVTLYAKQGRTLGSALSTQDIMALQRQEERRRQQAKQGVFGFMFKKSKEGSLSTDSLGGRSTSPARSDETARSASPLQPPARPQRKRRPAPKPPIPNHQANDSAPDSSKDKVVISHSRNSSDSSGYHEASVLSDNPDSAGRLPETLPRRNRAPGALDTPRDLAHTSQSSKSLGNLATVSGTLSHGISSTSLSSTGQRKKRAAPPPPVTKPLSSAISAQALERIVDSEESLTSDMDPSKPPSDIGAPSKASSDIEERPKASSDIGISTVNTKMIKPIVESKANELDARRDPEIKTSTPREPESHNKSGSVDVEKPESPSTVAEAPNVESAKVTAKRVDSAVGPVPLPMPRKTNLVPPKAPKRRLAPLSMPSRTLSSESERINRTDRQKSEAESKEIEEQHSRDEIDKRSSETTGKPMRSLSHESIEDDVFLTPIAGTPIDRKPNIFNDQLITSDSSKETNPREIDLPKSEIAMEKNSEGNVEVEKLSVSENKVENKKLCTIISTMPKCEHLDDGKNVCEIPAVEMSPKNDANHHIDEGDSKAIDTSVVDEKWKPSKLVKMHRSPSKADDFETNSLEKQKRHLTSHAEDITFALNMNVSSNLSMEVDRAETRQREDAVEATVEEDKGIAVAENSPSKTDILLQKVSDTLSSVESSPTVVEEVTSTPVESSDETLQQETKPDPISTVPLENAKDLRPKELSRNSQKLATNNSHNEASLNTSGEHATSQQDTSDYVSAVDDDLSIPDWEYQLPAPPSAFRDTASPVFENSDTITLGSVEAFKEPIAHIVRETSTRVDGAEKISVEDQNIKEEEVYIAEEMEKSRKKPVEDKVEELVVEKVAVAVKKPEASVELKKEVISELENKIGSGSLAQVSNREADSRKITDDTSTPKIAPVDNTLSNFTITTYTRQKNLSIFDEVDAQQTTAASKISDERFMKSFPTLSRGKNHQGNESDTQNSNLHDVVLRKPEPKIQDNQNRWQSLNGSEKAAVHRSRSHITAAENMKQNMQVRDSDRVSYSDNVATQRTDEIMKKSTSVTNLNMDAPKGNEKFSQWRENILKRQEEPTKEKQLQSLQVLKSILPQLKNAQQAEENVPKEPITSVIPEESRCETRSNEHSTESNVISTEVSQMAEQKRQESENLRKMTSEENNAKRYTYSGPPAITLGSWSERPNVNVQIKMDTDYKFGGANKVANGKTVVSINGVKLERDHSEPTIKREQSWEQGTFVKQEKEDKRESDELAKKLISHTTATGFKKPVLNKVNLMENKRGTEKPIVTGVELKKTVTVKSENEKNNESSIDTSPLNFKELTKAFGEVRLRPKPRRLINNRYSEHYDTSSESNQRLDMSVKQNGHCELSNGQSFSSESQNNVKPRRFTSVIGISQSQSGDQATSFPFKSGINVAKNNPPMPVVKGFKISSASLVNVNTSDRHRIQNGIASDAPKPPQPPKPPTMPVITGVTLKTSSARPKSMPVQIDPRDMLLESIRNFGGRGNLKSAVQRC